MKSWVKIARHTLAALFVGGILAIGGISLIRAIGTIGEPFSGFFVGPNLLVAIGQREGWPGIVGGLRSLDRIVQVNGVPVKSGKELHQKISDSYPGDRITYRIERGHDVKEITVAVTRYGLDDFVVGFLAPFFLGLVFVAFGAILYFTQPNSRSSVIYLALCSVIGSFCIVMYEAYTTYTFFRITLIYPLIGALSTHLFALFLDGRITRPKVRIAVVGVYLFAFTLVIWRQLALYDVGESLLLSKLSSRYVLLVLAVDALLLFRAFQKAPTQAARDKIKVIVTGVVLATSFIAAWSLNFILGTKPFYLDEGVLLASIFPVFMGYAVLRRNIFGLDRVIRLSLSYGISAAVILALYLGGLAAAREWWPGVAYRRYAGILFVVVAGMSALVFNVIRGWVNGWVYRGLFRGQHDLQQALHELDRLSASGLTTKQWLEVVGKRVFDAFNLERAVALAPSTSPTGQSIVSTFGWSNPPSIERWSTLFETEGFLKELEERAAPVELTDLASEHPDRFQQTLSTLRANQLELAIPFVSSGRLYGVLLLGQKKHQERYDQSDVTLLLPLVVRTGIGIENSRLTTEKEHQSRLAALGQVASIMIHDVKNPLTTIKIAAGSMKKKFREGDSSYELATIIEEEVQRMNQTVQEILQFVKPVGLSLSRVDICELVRAVVESVKPSYEQIGVNLIIDTPDHPIEMEIDEGRIRRALNNLLLNAMEALQRGGEVKVRLAEAGSGNGHSKITLTVEDNGPGMDAIVREQIFQPFFTTKPNGTGLGLAIVKQVVLEHSGEIELESRPGTGTRFVLHFPMGPKVK